MLLSKGSVRFFPERVGQSSLRSGRYFRLGIISQSHNFRRLIYGLIFVFMFVVGAAHGFETARVGSVFQYEGLPIEFSESVLDVNVHLTQTSGYSW